MTKDTISRVQAVETAAPAPCAPTVQVPDHAGHPLADLLKASSSGKADHSGMVDEALAKPRR